MKRVRAVVVSPHPDDAELGLGALLHRYAADWDITVVVMTDGAYRSLDGQTGRDGSEAMRQTEESLRLLGVTNICSMGLRTQDVHFDAATVCKIETVLSKVGAEVMFVPWHGDHHQDHYYAHLAAMAAGRKVRDAFGYCSGLFTTMTSNPFCPTSFFEVSSTDIDYKILACKTHQGEWDKFSKQFDVEGRLRARSGYFGSLAGTQWAEGFVCYRCVHV